jgi:organic hydroperoxide reductase OsmC/OhrA
MAQPEDQIYTTELIWDTGTDGTAIPREVPVRAIPVQVGPAGGWLPEHLMALGVAACFMSALLRLAETDGLAVLGFSSNSRVRIPRDSSRPSTLVLEPCIVVASEADARRVRRLCERAMQSSNMCRMVQDRLLLEPDVQVVSGVAEKEEP